MNTKRLINSTEEFAKMLEKCLESGEKGYFNADQLGLELRKWLDRAPDGYTIEKQVAYRGTSGGTSGGTVTQTYFDNAGQGGSSLITLRVKLHDKFYNLDFVLFSKNLETDPETCIEVSRTKSS